MTMTGMDFLDENCENCRFLAPDDFCDNPDSVYYRRPMVYRDGAEVLQTGWCDLWAASPEARTMRGGAENVSDA